ncbi:MAG: YigZ family protein [Acetivibrionales bacterium]
MKKEYRTVSKLAEAEIEEKKSRFIATVKPVSTEEEAQEFINEMKKRYWDATHNVYAYYIEGEAAIQKFSDDGEPSGTAGLPVLEVLKKAQVQDLVVVVTRYFGGTLLGAGGLVRAYSRSASAGIEAAGIVKKQLCIQAVVIVEYALLGKIQNLLSANNYMVKDIVYGQDAEMIVYVPVDCIERFRQLVDDATNASAVIEIGEELYVGIPSEDASG